MVETGYAFALGVDIPPLRRPGLKYIPLKGCEPLPFGAVYLRSRSDAALRLFLNLLEESLRD